MERISKKYKDNIPTNIKKRDFKYVFMTTANQLLLTKEVYQRHKYNGGVLGYLYFKENVPGHMYRWILNTTPPLDYYTMDVVEYLNKQFLKAHYFLYELKTRDNTNPTIDANIYRNSTNIAFVDECDGGPVTHTISKNYNNLMASDYGLIDVWAPKSTEFTNANMRYGNKIPIWQKSMNTRHYDRSNEGFQTTQCRASLYTPLSGYGSDFKNLVEAKNKLYIEQSTRGSLNNSNNELF